MSFRNEIRIVLFCVLVSIITGCSKETKKNDTTSGTWDIEKDGIPKFVEKNYIELEKNYRISKFCSSIGHDYSDAFEHCRSMKHYFEPLSNTDWALIKIYSPVTGIITRVDEEWAGTKLEIQSKDYPAFRFSIFHINSPQVRKINDMVEAGEQLGTHIGSQTMSDIAVMVNDPTHQGKMISYFEVIKDVVFLEYFNRAVNSREDLIISKEQRDNNPLSCNNDAFIGNETIENWVILK